MSVEVSYHELETLYGKYIKTLVASNECDDGIKRDLTVRLSLKEFRADEDDHLEFPQFTQWITSNVVWRAPDGVRHSSAGRYFGVDEKTK